MFITSVKLTKRKLIAAVVIVGVILCALIVWLAQRGAPAEQVAGTLPSVKNIKTNDDRVAFLTSCGWVVSPEAEQSQEVLIPDTFDETFTRYNELLKTDGFDLSKFRNKRVMRYAYRVLNHPTGEESVIATLLIYNNRIIGGDICSSKQDGFMHGLGGV